MYVFLLLTFNLFEIGCSIVFFGRRADLRAILKSTFLSLRHENIYTATEGLYRNNVARIRWPH